MSFEKLRVYQAADQFARDVEKLIPKLKRRNKSDADDLERAAPSIANNISEAYGRESTADKIYRLRIARGSCDESRGLLERFMKSGALTKSVALPLILRARAIAKMLTSLMKSVENGEWTHTPVLAPSPSTPLRSDSS